MVVIGVCASYDIFVHWDELWTIIFSKFRGSGDAKQEKLKSDAEVVSNGNNKGAASQSVADSQQVSPTSSANKIITNINGMTTRLSNGSSKVKSATAAQSKSQKRDIKKECNTIVESRTILTAVISRIGSI